MLGRLAWDNVRAGEHGVRTYLSVSAVAAAVFYAFNTIDEQRALIAGGLTLPTRFAEEIALLTLVLSGFVGSSGMLLGLSVTISDSRQIAVLRMLGADRRWLALLLFAEQGIAWLLGAGAGLAGGVILSHMLAFVTAAMLSGTVEGFRPFVSPKGLAVTLGCMIIVFVLTLGGSHLAMLLQRRRPRAFPGAIRWLARPAPSLVCGVCCLVASLAVFGSGHLHQGPLPVLHLLPCLVPLLLGLVLVIRGCGGALRQWMGNGEGLGRLGAVGRLAAVHVADFLRTEAVGVGFVAAGLVVVLLATGEALGAQLAVYDRLGQGLGGVPGAVRHVGESLAAMEYKGLFVGAVLFPTLLTLLFTLVLGHVTATWRDYRILQDLGCSRERVSRSMRVRVAAGFAVPVVFAYPQALLYLVVGCPDLPTAHAGHAALGLLPAAALLALVTWSYVAFTQRHCVRLMRELASDRRRGR